MVFFFSWLMTKFLLDCTEFRRLEIGKLLSMYASVFLIAFINLNLMNLFSVKLTCLTENTQPRFKIFVLAILFFPFYFRSAYKYGKFEI